MTNRKPLFLWALYDFSTTIVIIVFLVYFSQWLVVENHVADFWYNLIFVAASLLLVVTVPIASVAADKRKNRMSFLRVITLLQFCFFFLTGAVAAYFPRTSSTIVLAGILYLFSIYLHQFALVFYNALLPDIAASGAVGAGSGLGQSAKSLGTVAGILLSIPLAHGSFRFLGHAGRSQTFLPATVIALLLVLPCLWLEEPQPSAKAANTPLNGGYLELFRKLLSYPGLILFLLGFFFFNDAILTIQDNLPIYMQRVLMISDRLKSLFIASGLGAAAVGAFIGGKLADKMGSKKFLVWLLAAWAIVLPCLAAVQQVRIFGMLATLIGAIYGMTWAVSRALMASLAPRDQLSHSFGYYSITERFSTLCGPLAWGVIVTTLSRQGPDRYRVALLSMVGFILLGLFMVARVPADARRSVVS